MATNKFLIFDENKANLQSDLTYASDPQRINGVVPGQAKSVLHNKLFRQVSIMTYALGELIKNKGIQVDDSDPAILVSALSSAIGPTVVIDNLTSTSATSALSAKQGKALNDLVSTKSSKSTIQSKTLSAASWTGTEAPYSYSLTVTGVTTTSVQEIIPTTTITEAQLTALIDATIQDGGQATNRITLKAWGKKPTISIPVRVILRGDM